MFGHFFLKKKTLGYRVARERFFLKRNSVVTGNGSSDNCQKCMGPLLFSRVIVDHMRNRNRIWKSRFHLLFLSGPFAVFLDVVEINSSMLGICVFLYSVILFSFRESRAIFTDLSFLLVIIAGLTKQF